MVDSYLSLIPRGYDVSPFLLPWVEIPRPQVAARDCVAVPRTRLPRLWTWERWVKPGKQKIETNVESNSLFSRNNSAEEH